MKKINMLQIKGFNNLAEVMQYVQMIYAPEGYAQGLGKSAVIVPISLENYARLMHGKTLESYMQFFEENFGHATPMLIKQWKSAQTQEQDTSANIAAKISIETTLEDSRDLKDSISTDFKPLLSQQPDTIPPETPTTQTDDLLDQGLQLIRNTNTVLDEISSDPIRGVGKLLKNLFRKKPANAIDAYAKEQEKAEKEHRKQLQQEKAASDKALRTEALEKEKEQNALLQKQADEERNLLAAKKKREAEVAKLKKQAAKAKADEKKRLQKEREDARKQKVKASRKAQKQREKERKAKEKARAAERKKQKKK
jgi:hypothetical protein